MHPFIKAGVLGLSLSFMSLGVSVHAEAIPTFVSVSKPAAGTVIMVTKPEVELGLMTAAGTIDPKAEWVKSAQTYLSDAASQYFADKSYKATAKDLSQTEDSQSLQILKLNTAVTQSIAMNQWAKLPTKTSFDWSLGEGVKALNADAKDTPADYALFINAQGSYASAGLQAMNVGMALLGGPIRTGGQFIQSTLVDLKTGQIVWYEFSVVAPGVDIRTAEGAKTEMASLFKKLPLN